MSETSDRPGARHSGTATVRVRRHSRFTTWCRRHLNTRNVVALIVLLSLLAPEAAAIIDTAI